MPFPSVIVCARPRSRVQVCAAATSVVRARAGQFTRRPDRPCHWMAVLGAVLVLALPAGVRAEDADPRPSERGLPAVTVVPSASLGAPQLFAASVSGARLHVATLAGVNVFDGAHWELAPSSRAIYAVAASKLGRVVAGGPDALMELRVAAEGRRTLVSLLDALPDADRAIGDVRSIVVFDEMFLVVTDRMLLHLQGARLRVAARWSSDPARRGFASRGALYVTSHRGLEAFTPDGEPHADDLPARVAALGPVSVVADGPTDSQLVAVPGRGLFLVGAGAPRSVAGGAMGPLGTGVTDIRTLQSGAVAAATDRNGVVLLSATLGVDRVLGRAEGLPAPQVEAMVEDAEGGLWVVGTSQLARVDLRGPLSLIDTRLGLEGSVHGVVRHGGRLHVLTSAGLFVAADTAGAPRMTPVPGVPGRAWDAVDVDGTLVVATAAGMFEVAAPRARLVPGTARLSAYMLARRADRPDELLVGTRTGLSVLTRAGGGGWRYDRDVPGAPRYTRSLVQRPGGTVYVGSVFDGVVRLSLNDPTGAPTRYGGGEVSVQDVQGELLVLHANPAALSVLDESQGLLRPAPGARAVTDGAVDFAVDRQGALWTTGRGVERFPRGETTPRTMLGRSLSIQGIDVEPDGVVWLGGAHGLWRFTDEAVAGAPVRRPPTIERVYVNGQATSPARADGGPLALPFGIERLRLEFSPNTFSADAGLEFRLEPIDAGWSPERRGPSAEYTSLPEGEYQLHVRPSENAADAGTTWRFTVQPPWYRSPLVRALQLAVVVVGVLVVGHLRTDRLRRRSRELEHAVAVQTAALQEANRRLAEIASRDELTGLFNRRHFEAALGQEWARAHRLRRPIALVMADLDHFKGLNDTQGHVAGDVALRAVGGVIASCARRPGDVAARFGGEEFVVLLPGAQDDYVHALAEEIRAAVEALNLPHPAAPAQRVTVSVGVASVTAPTTLEPDLVAAADRALYRAKAGGRNAVAA
ncbi:MAG: diguanylate cyclase [Vicinamibacterales bacterium]